MNKFSLPFAAGISLLTFAVSMPDSHAFLGIFKKKSDQRAPSASEQDRMENEAAAEVREALGKEQAGNLGSALKAYKSVVERFPLTNAAAVSQYKVGELKERDGALSSAFDEYQEFIERFRRSSRFEQALGRQYSIAEKAKSGAKDSFLGIPRDFQDSRVIEMYEKVIKNAPFGKLAPLAQFSIAEIYQADGNKDEAVHNYQLVVDNYPTAANKEEALFRIGAINNAASRVSNDPTSIQDARDVLDIYLAENPEGDRAGDASAIMEQLDARQASKDFEIAQFYDKRGNHGAAWLYYKELAKHSDFENYSEVVERMEIIARDHPEATAIAGVAASAGGGSAAIPAMASTKTREDYVGPPAPELAKLTQKPAMRLGGDDMAPMLPIDEGDLPGSVGDTVSNPLLPNPADGVDSTLLIIPPAPEGGTVAIPPGPGTTPDLVIPPLFEGEGTVPPIEINPIASPPSAPSIETSSTPTPPTISIPPAPESAPAPSAPNPAIPSASESPVTPEAPPLPELPEIPIPPAASGS